MYTDICSQQTQLAEQTTISILDFLSCACLTTHASRLYFHVELVTRSLAV